MFLWSNFQAYENWPILFVFIKFSANTSITICLHLFCTWIQIEEPYNALVWQGEKKHKQNPLEINIQEKIACLHLNINFFHLTTETRFHFNMFFLYLFACQPLQLLTKNSTINVSKWMCVYLLHFAMQCPFTTIFTIWRNSHKDYTRWNYKRAAKAPTIIRGNLSFSCHHLFSVAFILLCWCNRMINAFVGDENYINICARENEYVFGVCLSVLKPKNLVKMRHEIPFSPILLLYSFFLIQNCVIITGITISM